MKGLREIIEEIMFLSIQRISIFIILISFKTCLCEDVGFNLFFKTNLEEMDDVEIHFENPVPRWIKGTLIRNGLGRFEVGERCFIHAFDGFGKLSSWKFAQNGSVYFSTRFLQSDFYKASVEADDIASYLMFEGVNPDFNEVQKIEALTRGIDNMNVNVYGIYNNVIDEVEYIALNDFWKIYKFHPKNLTTVSSITADLPSKSHFSGVYKFLSFLSSAHPLPEYGTTNHFTFVSSVSIVPWKKSKISLIRMKTSDQRELVAQWDVEKVPYMHSFSVSKNYAIFFASPFYVNVGKMIRTAEPFQSLDWDSKKPTFVYIVQISTGDVTTLQTENMFSMHHVNAFEDGDEIYVDVSSYPSPDFVKNLELGILRDPLKRNTFNPHAYLKRFVIDMNAEKVKLTEIELSSEIPFSINIDMPVINENFRHKHYCFIYGLVLKKDNVELSNIALVKKNVCGNSSEDKYWYIEGHYPVEPWFVPFPGSQTEDEGTLMVPIIDGFKGKSYLAILDAKTMKTVNRAYLPTVVPYSLHGRFFDELT